MNNNREVGPVAVVGLVQSGMSRCLFGDWPRRAILKLTHPSEGPSSFWIPQEEMAEKSQACGFRVGS